ncbi:ATP-binding protein [Methylobacterium sp. B4]|uniref:GAF domain-containing hybrid sensor histidine kinase/response regulator n=1 Tax=Methylobacterium sp. B4 TaxID=1938755 RepID=UPI000D76BC1C|nr:ATP-binding protein [Methylobacterium sp. B4]PXW65394.1 phospho-acceptor domain-containing protein [Methylobacterium sp. B4]
MSATVTAFPAWSRRSTEAREDGRADLDLLHGICVDLIGEQDLGALCGKIVDAAVRITGSQFGTMQRLCPPDHPSHPGHLEMLYSRGLTSEAEAGWQWVHPASVTSCTAALKRGQRAVIPDFEAWDDIAGTDDLLAFRRSGIRSAQTTPLMSRSGRLLGMISTHWKAPHEPTERDLRLLDILARQAADLLERTMAEDALRQSEERLRLSEARLRELNETLEARVRARTDDLLAAEGQLRQAQKMEAIGQLTGGLAHDFNNLLAGISGSLELMQIRMGQGRLGDVGRYMDVAQGAAKRAAALTHRLLAFSRRQTLDPKPTDVNRLVVDMEELVRRTIGPQIDLEVVGAAGLWPTLIDPGQLENALLNLCINARDAMPTGGRITIATGNRWVDRNYAARYDLPEGQYLSVSVTDTGTGMPPEVVARVFEPFFTTKPLGKGTGLGLSMIYGFAQQSGGHVRIQSEVGLGTRVCLYLPRHHGEALSDDIAGEAFALRPVGRGETVLVVDDEPSVRMLVVEVLEDMGYATIEAADGVAGLKVLQSDARIDLVVTDVGLPGGMNGRQMADAARERRRDLKVLFITGYAEGAAIGDRQLGPGLQVLTKPFAMDALAARVKELVGSRASAAG